MTNEEVLKKVIEKAGFRTEYGAVDSLLSYSRYYGLIFDHTFAKSFWGEELTCRDHGTVKSSNGCHHLWEDRAFIPAWKYHLQQIVLEEKPLHYIEKFL